MTPELTAAMRRVQGLLQVGSLAAARGELEALVAAHPRFVDGLRLLAVTQQALGDAAAAEALLRRALALEPQAGPTQAALGELLLASGRLAEAEPLLASAARAAPPETRATLLLARLYNDTARPAQALAVAAPLCISGAADAELATQHVNALLALGRAGEAITGYRRLLAAAPGYAAASQGLALALAATGAHAEAEEVAREALSRGPGSGQGSGQASAPLRRVYARSLIAQGRELGRAEEALREAIRLEPRESNAHSSLAQLIFMRTGEVAQATAVLDETLRTYAHDAALWATKAAILQGAGDARGAYACLEPWAARDAAPPALLVRAGLAALDFDPATAAALAGRALRQAPAHLPARTLLAAAQLGLGEAQAALAHCESLLAETPDDQYVIALKTTALRLLNDPRYTELCDYSSLVKAYRLEPPRPWSSLESFLADLAASLNRLHEPLGHALLFQSLRHGTETTQDLSRSTEPAIRALFEALAGPIQQYVAQLGPGADPLRRRNGAGWRFKGAWSVRLRRAGFHAQHTHPRGWISSACYITLPESMRDASRPDGTLTFGEPGLITRPALKAEHSVRPEPGMLVLFPSYLWHGTVPFDSPQPRLTVAFDAIPAR